MSSSNYHPPPQLHRVNLHSHGKRPFEECGGYDSDPDDSMPIQSTTSGTSSSNTHRFSTTTTATVNPETRNKRARSTSSTSTDDSSNPSSSGYNTAQSSSRSDLSDGPSTLPVNAADCPMRPVASPTPFVSTQQVHMSDLHLPIPLPQPQRSHVPTPPMPEDSLRTSLQRFAEFDRQIAALRTSLAATRSPPLPPFGPSVPSVDGDPAPANDHWHPNSSNFLPNAPPSSALDLASSNVPLAPSDTLDSLSTFASSSDNTNLVASTSAVPSASFTPTYSNVTRHPPYPPYRPSVGGPLSLVAHEHMGETIPSSSTPAIMRPSHENTTRMGARSSFFVDAPSTSTASHIRRVRGSLSPLGFPSDPSSLSSPPIVTDDILLRYRTPNGASDPVNTRSQRSALEDRQIPSSRLGDQSAGSSSHARPSDRARVIREHSTEREVPTVFDVFSISESSQNQSRSSSREPGAHRHATIAEPIAPRAPGTHNERSRGHTPITVATSANQASQDTFPRLNSSWASIPSSNSLMSESASERRHALALERFRARSHRSSFDADDESESRWLQDSTGEHEDPRVASPIPLSTTVDRARTSTHISSLGGSVPHPQLTANRPESLTSTSLHRSFSELFSETQRTAREERGDGWLLDWDASRVTEQERQLRERERERERERQVDRQRERTWEWEWERQRERSSADVRGRGLTAGASRPSTNVVREESSHPPVPTMVGPARPSLVLGSAPNTTPSAAATTTTTNISQQYSYSNLNLSSFQSGMFRDSLRRNAEVDQVSFSSSVMPSVNTGESRAASRIGFEDSESDMDLDDFVRTRPPSPEWSRPQPYAGRTPPPDYSPPPRNFSLRPGFSVLRRGSIVFDPPTRPQHPRSAFTSPVRPSTSGPTRQSTYENNHRPTPPERAERDRFLPTRIFESFYRSHEEGRRNTPTTGPPFHAPTHQNYMLASASRNERANMSGPRSASVGGNGNRTGTEEQRRGSLGLGGSIRSRLARFTNVQSSGTTESPTRPRLASHPIGARPQTDQRRASVLGGEQEVRNAGAMGWPTVVARDVPWRAPSEARGVFGPSTPAGPARGEVGEVEQRSRLRTLRQRFQLDRGSDGMRVFRPGMLRAAMGRRGNLGDYMPDELFDDSYEALLSLSSMLGEVRSRATPDDVIASLPTGTFKEWRKDDSESRCPICLEDYEPMDVVTKLIECPHWLHKNCLEQWLRTANTCPVCREKVKASPKPAPRRRPYRDSSSPPETNHVASSSTSGNGGRPTPTNSQPNHGRPVSFAAIVFDRMMHERDSNESWTSPASQATPGRNAFLDRMRAREQQRAREAQDLPVHIRMPPTGQPGPLSRPPTSTATGATDGLTRPTGFVSLLRGQGSDSSISTSSIVDETGPSTRRPMAPSFLDMPTQRRETVFPFVPPPPSFETHAPTISSSTESTREWRGGVRMYDVFNLEGSRSSSSGSSSSSSLSVPRPITNRLPIHEDSPSEEYMFGWHLEH